MKTPVKPEKSWAGKAMDKFSGKEDAVFAEKEDSQKKAADKMAAEKTIPEKTADEPLPPARSVKAPLMAKTEAKKAEERQQAVQEEETEAIRAPARKAGVHYIEEDQVYPANEQIVLARILTKPLMLAQFRYPSNPPFDPAKGDFYANVGGSWSALVGKVDAWMALPEF